MAKPTTPPPLTHGTPVTLPGGRAAEWLSLEEEGTSVRTEHFRCVDSLGLLLRNGSITPAMHDAGQAFHQTFFLAGMSPAGAPPLDRVRGNRGGDSRTERMAWAQHHLDRALAAVGGLASPGGGALWHVAGLGQSIKEWSLLTGWNGRRLNPHEAKGILVSALGALAVYYGYLPPPLEKGD